MKQFLSRVLMLCILIIVAQSCSKTGAGSISQPPTPTVVPTISYNSTPVMSSVTDSLPRGDSITVVATSSTGESLTLKVRPLKDTVLTFAFPRVVGTFSIRVKSRSATHNMLISGKYTVISKTGTLLSTGEVGNLSLTARDSAVLMTFRDDFMGSGYYDINHGDYPWQYWNKETEIEISIRNNVSYENRNIFKFWVTTDSLILEHIVGEGISRMRVRILYKRTPL